MSTATADNAQVAEAPKKRPSKKKLIVMLAIVLLVLAVAGAGLVVYLKKKAARAAEEAEGGEAAAQVEEHARHDPKNVPTFVPLEMFTVNLADREAERYAQVGVTLEIEDAHVADQIKAYMPAIRSNILMVLAQKTSADLLDAEGKKRLAFEIKRESARALGVEIEDEMAKAAAPAASGAASAAKAKVKKRLYEPSPVRQVHFSNFIIQ